MSTSSRLSLKVLRLQNDLTSSAVIQYYKSHGHFEKLAHQETRAIKKRDQEDDKQVADGIQRAIGKGVLSRVQASPPIRLKVDHQSAEEVAGLIQDHMKEHPETRLLVLFGNSGVGKGTTVAALKARLGSQAVTWSNGNLFRALTLVLLQSGPIQEEILQTSLKAYMDKVSFQKNPQTGEYDLCVTINSKREWVSQLQNTLLKEAKLSEKLPLVAKYSQGEVISMARQCVKTLAKEGKFVIMEGREPTLAYFPTPLRFDLCLADPEVVGARRLAQKLVGQYLAKHPKVASENFEPKDLTAVLEAMAPL